jgi:hypothetical protein
MKKYTLIALLFSALLIVSCGNDDQHPSLTHIGLTKVESKNINELSDNNPTKPYGIWLVSESKKDFRGGLLSIRTEVNFQKESITAVSKCSYDNSAVTARASARCLSSDTKITVLDEISKTDRIETSSGYFDCTVKINKDSFTYKRNGDKLELNDAKLKTSYTVQRVK